MSFVESQFVGELPREIQQVRNEWVTMGKADNERVTIDE